MPLNINSTSTIL